VVGARSCARIATNSAHCFGVSKASNSRKLRIQPRIYRVDKDSDFPVRWSSRLYPKVTRLFDNPIYSRCSVSFSRKIDILQRDFIRGRGELNRYLVKTDQRPELFCDMRHERVKQSQYRGKHKIHHG